MKSVRKITASRAATLIVAAAFAVLAVAMSVTACGDRQATMTAGGAVFDISPEILAEDAINDSSNPGTFASRADTLVDIGSVRAGEVVQYNAWLRNTGAEPLVITNVSTSCGCTSAEYEKQPIAPGGQGRFSFRFDSRGMWGMQMKLIEIRTSAASRPYKIMMRAEVGDN